MLELKKVIGNKDTELRAEMNTRGKRKLDSDGLRGRKLPGAGGGEGRANLSASTSGEGRPDPEKEEESMQRKRGFHASPPAL